MGGGAQHPGLRPPPVQLPYKGSGRALGEDWRPMQYHASPCKPMQAQDSCSVQEPWFALTMEGHGGLLRRWDPNSIYHIQPASPPLPAPLLQVPCPPRQICAAPLLLSLVGQSQGGRGPGVAWVASSSNRCARAVHKVAFSYGLL